MSGRRRTGPALAECRDCTLPIRFVQLDTGKAIPVNVKPRMAGNVAAHLIGGRLHGFVTTKDRKPGPLDDLFMPHAATCDARKPESQRPKAPEPEPLFQLP